MRIPIIVALVANVFFCNAQTSVRDLEKYLSELKAKPYQSLPKTVLEDSKNEDKLVRILQSRTSDSLLIVRLRTYYIVKQIGRRSKDLKIRQAAVTTLIKGIKDRDTGVSGSASEALSGFAKRDFNNDAIESLKKLVDPGTPHLHRIIKLMGYLDLKDQQSKLSEMLTSNAKANDKWASQLALSRMGETVATNFILDKVRSARINDDLIYTIVPDLVYTKQKQIFDYLVEIIQNDTPTCQSANPDSNAKILCGYRVMELIAPALENYPLPLDEFGELKIKDYKEGLTTVRKWFVDNADYKIKHEQY